MEIEDEWVCSDIWEHELEDDDNHDGEGIVQEKSGVGGEIGDSVSNAVNRKTKTVSPLHRHISSDDTKISKRDSDRKKGDRQHPHASSVPNGVRSDIGKKRGRRGSKPQDSYHAKGLKGPNDDGKKTKRKGVSSLDEKYPWNAVDCPIDDKKMTRGYNRLLDEKYPWNSIDCFGDVERKKKTKASKSLDEKYPWIGIECSAVNDTGLKKREFSESLDEKYPWNSIECSMGDASPTEKRKDKPVDEKHIWSSTECSKNDDASASYLYDCMSCSKAFSKQSELISHMKSEHADIKLYDCSLCQESFVRQAELSNHMDDVHEKEETYRCSLCKNVGYRDADRLISHMGVHHQMKASNTMYKDYLEGGIRTFRVREAYLTEEMRARQRSTIGLDADSDSLEDNCLSHNSPEKDVTERNAEYESPDLGVHICTFCESNETFTSKGKLDAHMNTSHDDIDNLRCSVCDDTFKIAGKLRDHLKKEHSIGRKMVYMFFLPDGWRTLKVKEEYSDAVKTSVEMENLCDVKTTPTKGAKENPTNGAKENPTKGAKENLTKGAKENPTKDTKETPTKGAKETPAKCAKETPTKAAKENSPKGVEEKPSKGAKENPSKGAKEEGGEKVNIVNDEKSPGNCDPDPQIAKSKSTRKGLMCRYCPGEEFFQNKRLLKQHYRSAHDDTKLNQCFKCSVCGVFYRHPKLVRRHMVTVHNLEYSMLLLSDELSVDGFYIVEVEDRRRDVPYSCAVCKENFTSKSELRTHTSLCTGSKKESQWGVFF